MKALLAFTLMCFSALNWAQPAHPLEGRLWAIESAEFITTEALFERLPAGGWLLLGEQHDHPEHHRIQTRWISALADRQQLGSVALEMADHSQQTHLDAARGKGDRLTPEMLHWQEGWPWTLYGEVVSTALNRAAAVAAADLTRDEQRRFYREGAPQGELEDEHASFMRDLLYESHCGQMPRQALDGMRQVQLARDQRMAEVLRQYADDRRTGVMLTGGIHARRDLGIPRWLHLPVISVLMIPADGSEAPTDYLPQGLPGHPVADYLLFTTALPDKDYCASFEEQPN
ncbi:ChaN family lipoprotein [Marinobacterium sediminicola]|uniref:Uncharacterized iron-regulated protein n=1 Tax=Marinobacterium sediminicola TaxID=518898 RepID=A0ABY1S103_9GAMM|nr:ChaN family lipoprotein [Marinobacterium sediminicola]ULG69617.1 ChaN family lipoprotein [Marinobacterium sediminicola]SMR74655.1 Uncharacterized iron-regulated protein [Marinobacterium sediminicola]